MYLSNYAEYIASVSNFRFRSQYDITNKNILIWALNAAASIFISEKNLKVRFVQHKNTKYDADRIKQALCDTHPGKTYYKLNLFISR